MENGFHVNFVLDMAQSVAKSSDDCLRLGVANGSIRTTKINKTFYSRLTSALLVDILASTFTKSTF